jgi:hypothetical protein
LHTGTLCRTISLNSAAWGVARDACGHSGEHVITSKRIRSYLIAAVSLTTAASLQGVISTSAHAAAAQNQVVSAAAASYTPDFQDGIVYAINQVGSRTLVGGSFTTVAPHGTTNNVTRNYVMAFNTATGAIDTGFVPQVDGVVESIVPGPSTDTAYLAGLFNNVNGVKSKAVVLLNTVTGAIVSGWKPAAVNGAGYTVRLAGGRLYLAGTFTTAAGVAHGGIVSLNQNTGALDPFMNVQLTDHHNYNGTGANGAVGPRAMDISPDGKTMVIIGNFKHANGLNYDQIVKVDLSGSSAAIDLTWNTLGYTAACASGAFDTYMRDVNFSPDGSYFAVGATGASGTNIDGSRSLCDSVTRWETGATGTNVQPTWVDYTGNDTILSIAVTGTAVYAGGHMRWMNNPNSYDSPGAGAVPRPGLVALDPNSGIPLTWNPGRNPRGSGAWALFASTTGLYVGSDTDYFGNKYQYHNKKLGYFPLAGGYVPASTATQSLPSNIFLAGPLATSNNTNVLYRVDAAGPAVAAMDNGPDWIADDSDSAPAAVYRLNSSNTAGYSPSAARSAALPAYAPSQLFDSERWGEQHWSFPVTAGTQVNVNLFFANRYSGTSGVGQRVFNIGIDGTTVQPSYDIVADVGDQTGTMKSYTVTSPGNVTIDLTAITENPLINGIEIVKAGPPPAPAPGGVDDLAYRAYSGSTIGALTTVPNTGIAWSTTRGAFAVGNTLFYGKNDGTFYKAPLSGTSIGASTAIDPYNDPNWSTVDTGSGQTYRGVVTDYYGQLNSVTGAFYNNGRMYYSLLGQSSLFYRWFSPDSGIIGGTQYTASGGNFSNTAGEFLSGNTLYYANRADGTLHTVSFAAGVVSGADTVVSGPGVDGNDWRARSLFAYGTPTLPNQLPTASATSSCTNLNCTFNGTNSNDPDGTIASYAWTFGDGTTSTTTTPTTSHSYAGTGTYPVTLVVTDNRGGSSSAWNGSVSVTAPAVAPISYVATSHSYAAASAAPSVVAPAGIQAGDTELLSVTTNTVGTTGTPGGTLTGWTQVATQASSTVLQTTLFRRTAGASDSGAAVSVPLSASSGVSLQLAVYRGVGSAAVVSAGSADASTATHVAPAVTVATGGSWVLNYWTDKSSTTTAWTLPAGVTSRDINIGTGGGRVTVALGDSGAALASGTYPAQTATVTGGASGKGAMLSIVLAPQS